MAIELANAMNKEVSCHLVKYLQQKYPSILPNFINDESYTDFVVVFNEVSRKLSFGNKSSGFEIINNRQNYKCTILEKNTNCWNSKVSPSFANWGLSWYLGFDNNDCDSYEIFPYQPGDIYDINLTPQLAYLTNPDERYWLQPSQMKSCVYVVECPLVINIECDNVFFIEVSGLNILDETKPFQISDYTKTTNGTIGVINSALAKVSINKNNRQEECNQPIYKYYDPPAERIRRFCITLRYHDGRLVCFENQDFNIVFELGLLTPHNEKRMSVQVPEAVKYFY